MKKNKGITLIALVITIIILIILAAVSISILMGEDGLITKAKQGALNYQNAALEEQEMLNNFHEDFEDEIANATGEEITYSVTFNYKNGINKQSIETYEIGKIEKLKKHEYELNDCVFAGWAIEEKGDVIYTDEQEIQDLVGKKQNIQLYARYSHTHSSSCKRYVTMEAGGLTNIIGYYNLYLDEECTIPADTDIKLRRGSADYLTGVVKIEVNSETYYAKEGSYVKKTESQYIWYEECPICRRRVSTINDWHDNIAHLHNDGCGKAEGLQ